MERQAQPQHAAGENIGNGGGRGRHYKQQNRCPANGKGHQAATTAPKATAEVCLNFQSGNCRNARDCKLFHPKTACHFELMQRGGCKKKLHCNFSHNPDVLRRAEQRAPGPASSHADTSDDDLSDSSQEPPARRFPLQELPAKQTRPNLKLVEITHKLRGTNLFWLKAANSANLGRKLKLSPKASGLLALDELRGKAFATEVTLIAGSLNTSKQPKSSAAAYRDKFVEPNSIRLKGPMDSVKDIRDAIEEQEKILDGMKKFEERWLFTNDPWATSLVGANDSKPDLLHILNQTSNDKYAWWELVTDEKTNSKAAQQRAAEQTAASSCLSGMWIDMAYAKIGEAKLQVAYTPNIVASEADAIVISCGPYMYMEDGVAQDITDWYANSKDLAQLAKEKKFGHGPMKPYDYVAVTVPASSNASGSSSKKGRSRQIFCTYLPPASNDSTKHTAAIQQAMKNVLQHIVKWNADPGTTSQTRIQTVALPLLGTGRYGYPTEVAARAVLSEILAQLAGSGIKRVLLLDQRVQPLDALTSALKVEADARRVTCNLRNLPVKTTTRPGWFYFVGAQEGGSTDNIDNARKNSIDMGPILERIDGAWFPLFPDVSERVEAAYQRWLPAKPQASSSSPALPSTLPANMQSPPSATITFNIDNIKYPDGMVYEIAFDKSPMKQRNTHTGFQRTVSRENRTFYEPNMSEIDKTFDEIRNSLADLAGRQSARAADKVLGIRYIALDQRSAADAIRQAKNDIRDKFGVQSFCIPLPEHVLSTAEQQEVRALLSGLPISLGITVGASSSTVQLTGLASDLDTAKEKIVESRVYTANSKFVYPSAWSCTTANQAAVVTVGANSKEFHEVAAKFTKDMPAAKVTQVQRVQNDLLWKAYQGNLRILHERYSVNGMRLFKDSELVKELWHGTSTAKPETVALSAFGTERAYSRDSCQWGAGNYFSTTSSYSDRYSHPLPGSSKLKQMVLFEVMTGHAFDCKPDDSLKKPPLLPAGHSALAGFGDAGAPSNLPYDSVTGITEKTRVYITYSTGVAQQYPHYIVTYNQA